LREFLIKVNPSLAMRDECDGLSDRKQIAFLREIRKKVGILCLLTQISPVRIDRVGPRIGLELKTEQLTQQFKSAVFLTVFFLPQMAPSRPRSAFFVQIAFQSKAIGLVGYPSSRPRKIAWRSLP
jgi:hypothetical protein